MKTQKAKYASMDEYIASFPEDVQAVLRQIRETIKATVPDAEETISYGIPTFLRNGKYLIYFAGWQKHISIYPIPLGSEAFNTEAAKYTEGSGTLKFPLDRPIPLKLIARAAKYAVAANKKRTETKK